MGGTSADIGICDRGGSQRRPHATRGSAGYPLLVRCSTCTRSARGGGLYRLRRRAEPSESGPRSAGADPAPLLRQRREEPDELVDAHSSRRLDGTLPGRRMALGPRRVRSSVGRLAEQLGLRRAETADGILTIANSNMARAIARAQSRRATPARVRRLVWLRRRGPAAWGRGGASRSDTEVLVRRTRITSAAGLLRSDLKYDQMRTGAPGAGVGGRDRINRELDGLGRSCVPCSTATGVAEATSG